MNFSNTIKYSGQVQYSPNGNYLAIAKGKNLIVYETKSLIIKQKYLFNDLISQIEWSLDSNLVLVVLVKLSQCYIKAIELNEWNCLIDEGLSGISYIKWAPDSRRILVFDEFNTKITIYALGDQTSYMISNPKFNSENGLSYSSNGCFMALIERREWHDSIGIYFIGNWSLVSHFSIETNDAQGILWNKDNTALIIWDTPIENRFFVYSPTGNLIKSQETNRDSLGVINVMTSPNGHLMSVGCFDQSVFLFNQMTWKFISKLSHSMSDLNNKAGYNIFKEEAVINKENNYLSRYVECNSFPISVLKGKTNENKSGVRMVEYSFDSNYLATVDDTYSNIVWIWQISSLTLHTVILQLKPIKHLKWSPNNHQLIIGTDYPKCYFFAWTDMYIIDLIYDKASSFSINRIEWNPDGKSFILCDKFNLIIGNTEVDAEGEEVN